MAWERLMADLALQLGDHETATRHALRVLYSLRTHLLPLLHAGINLQKHIGRTKQCVIQANRSCSNAA